MLNRLTILANLGLLTVLVLAGCKAQATQSSTATAVTPLVSSTPFPTTTSAPTSTASGEYPGISQTAETIYPSPINPTLDAYPAPTEYQPYPAPTEFQSAYPQPGEPSPQAYPGYTESAQSAYPAPTESPIAAYPNPTQPPAAYPGPTQPSGPSSTPVSATASPTAISGTSIPTSTPVPTNTPLPAPTAIPTVSPTPGLPPPIRTELFASDPEQFELVSGEVQLVEFFAYWCVACRSQADGIHQLEALYGSRMNFVYLDIDDPANQKFEQALGFSYEPDFFLLDPQGRTLQEWSGWVRIEDIRNAIEGALRVY